jgi:dihydroorotase-like cyclic amidohydrolase
MMFICHVSSKAELKFVLKAKEEGLPITCGITPHHLFLTNKDADRLGPYGHMKPFLKPQADVDFLWQHLDGVDIIESDHAPHTKAEKDSDTPPFGVPGLETTLPLMLTAQQEGKLSEAKLKSLLHDRPAKIFDIANDDSTSVVVVLEDTILTNDSLKTKCGWTPFAGQHVAGYVKSVTLHGQLAYEDGQVLAKPGSGNIIPIAS